MIEVKIIIPLEISYRLTIEPILMDKIWACNPTFFKQASFWCPFLDPHILTCVIMVLFFLYTVWVSIMTFSFLFWYHYGMGIWYYLCFHYQLGLGAMQKPSYIGKRTLTSTWFTMVLTQVITHVHKDFSHLDIPTKTTIVFGVTVLIHMDMFFDTTIDVDYWYHASTCKPYQTLVTMCH